MQHRSWIMVAATLILGACGSADGPVGDDPPRVPTTPVHPYDRSVSPTTGVPGDASVGGVADDLLEPLVADAAARASVDRASVEVLRAQQVVWNDGSLGCPIPGVGYTQALTPGYWIVLSAGGSEHDYRAALDGDFRPCVGGAPPYEVLVDR
jgi:hypothetical protein